jgi:hypothetical protein
MPPVTVNQYLACLRENGAARSFATPPSSTGAVGPPNASRGVTSRG